MSVLGDFSGYVRLNLCIQSELGEDIDQKSSKYGHFLHNVSFLKQVLQHSSNFFRIATFSTKVLLQKKYIFRTDTFWKTLSSQKSYILHHLLFMGSYFSKDIFFIRSYSLEQLAFDS